MRRLDLVTSLGQPGGQGSPNPRVILDDEHGCHDRQR
jgi:hypothetical protein